MNIKEIIAKKRDRNKLNKEEIISIRQRAEEDYYICNDAINLLKNENHNGAFNKFSEVLNDFNG